MTVSLQGMRTLLLLVLGVFLLLFLAQYCESRRDPYEEGTHWNYEIRCEGGFVYKVLDHRRGTIQILNSDGTPLRCGQKRH